MENKIAIITNLQMGCYEAYSNIVSRLQQGINELEVEKLIRLEMAKKGITEYWYDVPIIVTFGTKRFLDIANKDYAIKRPKLDVHLQVGDPIYIDIHPQDTKTKLWGDWNSMSVFNPRKGVDDEQVSFLDEVRTIQREGIERLRSDMTASDIASFYFTEFEKRSVVLSDARNNVGHSMHAGPKLPEKRTFLEKGFQKILGEGIYAIEPGGYRAKKSGDGIVVARFEECVYIPEEGKSKLLGILEELPLVID